MEKTCETEKPGFRTRKVTQQSDEICKFALDHGVVLDYLLAILNDCHKLLPLYGVVDLARDIKTVKRRFAHEGLSFATKTLPSFFDSVVTYLETGVSAYHSFRKKRGAAYPVFLQQLTAQIYEHPYDDCTVKCMECLYQFCVAFKKLQGPYKNGVLAKQLCEFVNVDEDLPRESSSVMQDKILARAYEIVTDVCDGLDPQDPDQAELFTPRPGPGATNTPTDRHMRYRPHVLYTQLSEEFNYKEWFFPPNSSQQYHRWDLRCGTYRDIRHLKTDISPTSRFKFVPKTYSKARGICIEELEMQWLQQGIRKALYHRIEHHPMTSGFVNFTNQNINGSLALQASFSSEYATIDMSSASDRIPRWLVERLFSGNENLMRALIACSTTKIKLPKQKGLPSQMNVRKYAPMGSALCFPVMGLVHFALITAIVEFFSLPWMNFPVWVYGDDIVVPTRTARLVMTYLPIFGMKINKEKSFYNSRFRESCGVHAYNGVDITPIRFKSIVKSPARNQELISAVKNEAALYKKGFKDTALLIRQQVQKVFQHRVNVSSFPFVGPKSSVLGWIREANDAPRVRHLGYKRRWVDNFQRFEYSVLVLEPRVEKPPLLSEGEGYLHALVMQPENDNIVEFGPQKQDVGARRVGGLSEELLIRRRWVPSSAFVNSLGKN